MDKQIFKVFITFSGSLYEHYFFRGSKETLMSLIGCLYSTSFIQIERIAYQEIKAIPNDLCEINYFFTASGEIRIYTSDPGGFQFC